MLYHVPDRDKALSEMRRVLKPGGRLYVATNGLSHLAELWELIRAFDPSIELPNPDLGFTLEDGAAQLLPHFHQVELRRYDDGLVVTEIEPLIAYLLSMGKMGAGLEGRLGNFVDHVQREMDRQGAIRVTKAPCMFVATR
jgi:SAM-dependent methyltransferase